MLLCLAYTGLKLTQVFIYAWSGTLLTIEVIFLLYKNKKLQVVLFLKNNIMIYLYRVKNFEMPFTHHGGSVIPD